MLPLDIVIHATKNTPAEAHDFASVIESPRSAKYVHSNPYIYHILCTTAYLISSPNAVASA